MDYLASGILLVVALLAEYLVLRLSGEKLL